MRHGNANRKFGRERGLRVALMRSLAESLIKHGKITTTDAKARELRSYVEKLITKARVDSVNSRRLVVAKLGTKERAKPLFAGLAKRYEGRPGGYTRITKLPPRKSDGSKMAVIEFV